MNNELFGGYAVDFVFCVDKTSSSIIDHIRSFVEKTVDTLLEEMDFIDKKIIALRVKIIAFGDLSISAFDKSVFYDYYNNEEKTNLQKFCQTIKLELWNNGCTVDALEALASAVDSEWTNKGSKRRHIIVMLNQHTCSVLGAHRTSVYYPDNMPIDLRQLTDWWEGTETTLRGAYQSKYGRLVALVPSTEPWTDLQCWNRYWPEFWERKAPIDFESIMMLLSRGFV